MNITLKECGAAFNGKTFKSNSLDDLMHFYIREKITKGDLDSKAITEALTGGISNEGIEYARNLILNNVSHTMTIKEYIDSVDNKDQLSTELRSLVTSSARMGVDVSDRIIHFSSLTSSTLKGFKYSDGQVYIADNTSTKAETIGHEIIHTVTDRIIDSNSPQADTFRGVVVELMLDFFNRHGDSGNPIVDELNTILSNLTSQGKATSALKEFVARVLDGSLLDEATNLALGDDTISAETSKTIMGSLRDMLRNIIDSIADMLIKSLGLRATSKMTLREAMLKNIAAYEATFDTKMLPTEVAASIEEEKKASDEQAAELANPGNALFARDAAILEVINDPDTAPYYDLLSDSQQELYIQAKLKYDETTNEDLAHLLFTFLEDASPINEKVLRTKLESLGESIENSIATNKIGSKVEGQKFIKSLFPHAVFGNANQVDLIADINLFSKNANEDDATSVKKLIRNIWYNWMTIEEKQAIRTDLKATYNDPTLVGSQGRPGLTVFTTVPKTVKFDGQEWRVEVKGKEDDPNPNDSVVVTLYRTKKVVVDGKEELKNITLRYLVAGNNVSEWKFGKDPTPVLKRPRYNVLHDIAAIHKYNTSNFTLSDELPDSEIINALALHFTYSNISDPEIITKGRMATFLQGAGNLNPTLLDKIMISISDGTYTTDASRTYSEEERTLDNLFGRLDKTSNKMVAGYAKANSGLALIKNIMHTLVTGNYPLETDDNYGMFDAAEELIKIGSISNSIDSDLIRILEKIASSPAPIKPKSPDLIQMIRYSNQVKARETAKYLLEPLGSNYAVTRKAATTFKGPRVDFLYGVITGKRVKEEKNRVESLEGLNDKIDYSSSAPDIIKSFLGFIPKVGRMRGYYSYNYSFVQALKLFNNPKFRAAWSNMDSKLDLEGTYLRKGTMQYNLAQRLFEMSKVLTSTTGLTHIKIITNKKSATMVVAKSRKDKIWDLNENDLDAMIKANPTKFTIIKASSPIRLFEAAKELDIKSFSKGDKNQLDAKNFGEIVRRESTLELFRDMTNYLGSITEKKYLFFDNTNFEAKYVGYKYRNKSNTVANVVEDILSDISVENKDGTINVKRIPTIQSTGSIDDRFSSLLTNLGLEGFSTQIMLLADTTKGNIINGYDTLVGRLNKEISSFNSYIKEGTKDIDLVAINDLEAIFREIVTAHTEDLKLLSETMDSLLEVYTSNVVKDMKGDNIYAYTLSSYAQDIIENLVNNDDGRIIDFGLYDGSKSGDFTKQFMKEFSGDFAFRDLETFSSKSKVNTYQHTIINQSDKFKSIVFKMKKFVSPTKEREAVKDVINKLKQQKNGAGLLIPIKVGNKVKEINVNSELSTDKILDYLENEYLDYLKDYLEELEITTPKLNRITKNFSDPKYDEVLRSYIRHNFANNHYLLTSIAGKLDSFENDVDLVKRMQGAFAPGNTLWTGAMGANKSFSVVQLKDIERNSENLFEGDETVKGLFDQYYSTLKEFYKQAYEVTDGQGIITENRLRELQLGLGHSYKLGGVVKPVIYDGSQYYKYSAYVLTKSLAEQLGILPLYDAINSIEAKVKESTGNNVEFIFESAAKKEKNISNGQEFKSASITQEELLSGNFDYAKVKNIKTEFYRMQSNPMSGNPVTAFPIQPTQFLAGVGQSHQVVTQAWNNMVIALTSKVQNTFPKISTENMAALQERIKNFVRSKLSNDDYLTASLLDAGLPLNSSIIKDDVMETLVTNLFKEVNDNISYSTSGSLVLASSGMLPEDKRPRYKLSKDLDGNYKFYAQAIVYKNYLSDDQINLVDALNQKKKLVESGEDIDPEILERLDSIINGRGYPTLIGFRMPTTGLHSMVSFEITDYHNEDAKTIFLPDELAILHGADFDVDKLNIMAQQIIKGRIVGEDENGIFNPNLTSDEIKNFNINEQVAYYKNQIYHEFQQVLENAAYDDKQVVDTYVDENGITQNLYTSTPRLNEIGLHMLNPISTRKIDNVANQEEELPTVNVLLPHSKFMMHEVVSVGRNGVGTFANVPKLKAALVGQQFRTPITISIGGVTKTFTEISASLDSNKDNLLIIDAFINAAIDNLKLFKLSRLGITPRNLNTVSALLLLGVGNKTHNPPNKNSKFTAENDDIKFISQFLKENDLVEKTLDQKIQEFTEEDSRLTDYSLRTWVRTYEEMLAKLDDPNSKYGKEIINEHALLQLALFQRENVKLIVALNIMREGPINQDQLMEYNELINDILQYEKLDNKEIARREKWAEELERIDKGTWKAREDDPFVETDKNKRREQLVTLLFDESKVNLPTTFNTDFNTLLAKVNPHVHSMFEYALWAENMTGVVDGSIDTSGTIDAESTITRGSGLAVTNTVEFSKLISDYFIVSQLELGDYDGNVHAFMDDVLGRLKIAKQLNPENEILQKLHITYQRRKGYLLRSFLGERKQHELFWDQAAFKQLDQSIREDLMKYMIISSTYKGDSKSYAKLFNSEDWKSFPLGKNGESFAELAQYTDLNKVSDLITGPLLEHLKLILFANSDVFKNRNRGGFNDKTRASNALEIEADLSIIDDELGDGSNKLSELSKDGQSLTDEIEIEGERRIIFSDLRALTRLPGKEDDPDYRKTKEHIAQENAYNSYDSAKGESEAERLMNLMEVVNKQLPLWKTYNKFTYYRVYVDYYKGIGYYQKVNKSVAIPSMVPGYKIDNFYDASYPTLTNDTVDNRIFLPTLKGVPKVYIIRADDVDRTGRRLFTADPSAPGYFNFTEVKKSEDIVKENKLDESVENKLVPGDTVSMSKLLADLAAFEKTKEEFLRDIIDDEFKKKGNRAVTKFGRVFDTANDLFNFQMRNIELGKIRGKYNEAAFMNKAFGLTVDLDSIANEIDALIDFPSIGGGRLTINEYAKENLVSAVSWMADADKLKRVLKRYGINDDSKLMQINPITGTIEEFTGTDFASYNRTFHSDALNMDGEYDLLVKNRDGRMVLVDIKSSKLRGIDTINDESKILHHGKQGPISFSTSTIDQGKIQVMGYAMALKSIDPTIRFQHLGILNVYDLAEASTVNGLNTVPIEYAMGVIRDFYRDEMQHDLRTTNPELLDLKSYDDSRIPPATLADQPAYEAAFLEARKNMIWFAEKARSYKQYKGEDYYQAKENLEAAERTFRAFAADSVLVNTSEGIDDIAMYIGSKSRYGDPDIQLWSKEFDKAYLKAIRKKEADFKEFKRLQKNYFEYKGIGRSIITRGNMQHYEDLMMEDPNGVLMLKPVASLIHPSEKELVTFLNTKYKEIFDKLERDKSSAHRQVNGDVVEMSSLEYQTKILGDQIVYYEGWMPKVPKGMAELRYNFKIGDIGTTLKALKDRYLTFWYEKEYERLDRFGDMAIPIKYANENRSNKEDMSLNLEKQFDLFNSWSTFKFEMEHVHALGTAIKLKNESSTDPRIKNVAEWMNVQNKMLIQGVRQDDIIASNAGNITQGIRKIQMLSSSIVASLLLSFNYIGGIKNAISIVSSYSKNTVRQFLAKTVFRGTDYMYDQRIDHYTVGMGLSMKAMTNDMMGNDDKLMMMFREFGFSVKYRPQRANNHRYGDAGYLVNMKTAATFLYSVPEEITSMASLYASMKSIPVTKDNPMSLWDAYKVEDGKLVYTGPDRGLYGNGGLQLRGVAQEEITKMKYMTELTNGSYRPDEKTMLDYSLIGSLFLTFKRTLIGNLSSGAQGAHSSAALGHFVEKDGQLKWENITHEGRWSVLGGIIKSYIDPKGREAYRMKNLTLGQKGQLMQIGVDLVVFALITALIGAGGDASPDDKQKFSYKLLNGLNTDMANAVFPFSLVKNPTPVTLAVGSRAIDSSLDASWYAFNGYILGSESAFKSDGSLKGNSIISQLFPAIKLVDVLSDKKNANFDE